MQVHVFGAGVAGLVVASELVSRGHRVAVYERGPGPGPQACSWWAGGMLAPWCERESAEEPVLRLGQAAAPWWQSHAGGVHRNGTLVLASRRDQAELARFARRTTGHHAMDGDAIGTLEPDLAGRFQRGLFFAQEAHLAPREALAALVRNLAERGCDLHWNTKAGPVAPEPVAPEGVTIDCRGMAARADLPDLRGVKGEMLILRCPDIALSRPVRLLHPRWPLYVVPRGDGVFMLGATMIESAERGRISARAMLELLGIAYALHPAFAEAEILEIGVDVRPAFRDNLPRVIQKDGRIYLNGLYRHGFLLSPAMAMQIGDLLAAMPGNKEKRVQDACRT